MTVRDDSTAYIVLVNHEEQYSLWPASRTVPNGWTKVGPQGSRDVCLEYISETWTDMRPKSLREDIADSNQSSRVENNASESLEPTDHKNTEAK